jgi:hypothetical protein
MSENDPPGVATGGGLMLALLPPLGVGWPGPRAQLKWAGPEPLVIEESRLSSPGDAPIVEFGDAMGLTRGTRIIAPASLSLLEPRRTGDTPSWCVNGLTATAMPLDPAQTMAVMWFPLLLPLADDPHFLVALVHAGPGPLPLPELVYESRLTIDREAFAFADPGHWDGRARVNAGAGAVLRFRFEHFGARIPDGPATMTYRCGPWTSSPVSVAWRQTHV